VSQAPPASGDAAPILVDPAPPAAPEKHHTPLWKRPLKLIPFF
jgi:hypothetical protein